MTNEEAIKWFQQSAFYHEKHEPFNMAIKALSQQTEDAISRQAAIDALTKTSGIRGDALKALYDLPSVTPKQRTGHWISHYEDEAKVGWYECSCCQSERAFNTSYCPDCGAKMGGA